MTARRAIAERHGWPLWMDAATAAAYVGVCKTTFLKEVRAKIWPEGDRRGGRVLWHRELLELASRRRAGLPADPPGAQPAGESGRAELAAASSAAIEAVRASRW